MATVQLPGKSTLDMASRKIESLAAATKNGDAVRYEQISHLANSLEELVWPDAYTADFEVVAGQVWRDGPHRYRRRGTGISVTSGNFTASTPPTNGDIHWELIDADNKLDQHAFIPTGVDAMGDTVQVNTLHGHTFQAFVLTEQHTFMGVEYIPGLYIWDDAPNFVWVRVSNLIEDEGEIWSAEADFVQGSIVSFQDGADWKTYIRTGADIEGDTANPAPNTAMSGWTDSAAAKQDTLPNLHFGGIWTNAGTTAAPNYISDTVDIVGILSDQHSNHNFATEAAWQNDTTTDFERGQYVTVTAEADKIWKVLNTTVGYGVAGDYMELAIDDEDTENLLLATASDLDRALGRFPTTESWQNNRFLPKGTTFPTTPALGDEFFLDVSVSGDDGANERPRGLYTFLQPLPDPASHFWEQVTPSAIGQLYNNARVGDVVYLQYEEANFNTAGNDFTPGLYRATETAVAAPNHTTWGAVTTRTDVVAGTGVTVDNVDNNGVITSTITSDTVLNRADVTVPTEQNRILRTGRVEDIGTFVADASVGVPAVAPATDNTPAWVTVGPSTGTTDPATGNLAFLNITPAADPADPDIVTNAAQWADVTHIRVVEADADANDVLENADPRDDLLILYNSLTLVADLNNWALLTVQTGGSTTAGGFRTLPVAAVAGENNGAVRAEAGRLVFSNDVTGFNARNVLRFTDNDDNLTHRGVFDLEESGIETVTTGDNTNTTIGVRGTAGTVDRTATLHHAPVNAMAYLAIQFHASIPTDITATITGTPLAGHIYLQYDSVWDGTTDTTFVDQINTTTGATVTYRNFSLTTASGDPVDQL